MNESEVSREIRLEFDDVLIRPIPSTVESRDDVDISVQVSDYLTLKFPLIASPMVGVTDGKFAHLLSKLGGLAILHRFYKNHSALIRDIRKNLKKGDNFGLSVGIGGVGYEEYLEYSPAILLVDTANGYNTGLLRYCAKLKDYILKKGYTTLLMAGNVVTRAGCINLSENGVDLIRVGIGGGSPCSTRNQTGIGIPNLSAIMECETGLYDDYKIVIDGGIKNSGDFVKSVVAGASLGISGKLYAQCYEAPNKGKLYGMSSRTHMENTGKRIKSVEGFDTKITKQYSLEQFVREFGYGIKSAGTYLNATTLDEIYIHGDFILVTDHAIKK